MYDVANELSAVLDSLGESPHFCVTGAESPVLPGLVMKAGAPIGMPISAADARKLIAGASQAPYGRGEDTIVDTSVRRVWQLEPKQVSLRNSSWKPFVEGIVDNVRKELSIRQKVEFSFYKLLVYEKGSFFAPHRDSEKTKGMFATLVISLPSPHEGGTLLVTNDGQTKRVDFGGDGSEFEIRYAAFYADCQHEILPLRDGYRVCLIYNLAICGRRSQPKAPVNSGAADTVANLLSKLFADGSLDRVAVPFKHQYTEAGLDPKALKGIDRSRADVLLRAAEQLGYKIYFALLTRYQEGSVDYSTWDDSDERYRSRYRRDYDDYDDDENALPANADDHTEFEDVFEDALTLEYWMNARGQRKALGKMSLEQSEILNNGGEVRPFKQEISEATGNEGATMERWYRQGVIVIWPRDRQLRILAREGPASAIAALEDMMGRRSQRTSPESWHAFAAEIIHQWEAASRYEETASLTTRMLKIILRIGSLELAERFVYNILPLHRDGSEGSVLRRVCSQFGWKELAPALCRFFEKQMPGDYGAELIVPVRIFQALCGPPAMTSDRLGACIDVAGQVERLILRWDSYKGNAWHMDYLKRDGIIEAIFPAYAALRRPDALERFVEHVISQPRQYGLHEVLIPAVKSLRAGDAAGAPVAGAYQRLKEYCLAELRARTAAPVEPPATWARDATIDCRCPDCRELARYLRDPAEQSHRFAVRKERRRHLHQQIGSHQCDLTHVTERAGSPQTLVCTKTRASYKRRLRQFDIDSQLLKELESGKKRANAPARPRPV